MTIRFAAGAAMALAMAVSPATAADDASLSRMMLCKDSWLDWKNDPRLKTFGDHIHAVFTQHGNDPFLVPKAEVSVAGFRVLQAYPQSVGMGVGFSLLVAAPFDTVRKRVEQEFGKPLTKCDNGDGMRTCELDIAPQRNFTLMTEDGDAGKTLVGCYYFYEK